MNKAELLKRLDELILLEEQSIPIYTQHVEAVLAWSGFSEGLRQRAGAVMKMLAEESLAHKRSLEGLKAEVAGRSADVF